MTNSFFTPVVLSKQWWGLCGSSVHGFSLDCGLGLPVGHIVERTDALECHHHPTVGGTACKAQQLTHEAAIENSSMA